MNTRCPLCGHTFEHDPSVSCAGCPVARGCRATCCPSCAYSWVEPQRSGVGRWLARWLRVPTSPHRYELHSLADVPPRRWARIVSCEALPNHGRRRLRAYGLVDGGIVGVVQQYPATTILLDHVEIALEPDLARCIRVEILEAADPAG